MFLYVVYRHNNPQIFVDQSQRAYYITRYNQTVACVRWQNKSPRNGGNDVQWCVQRVHGQNNKEICEDVFFILSSWRKIIAKTLPALPVHYWWTFSETQNFNKTIYFHHEIHLVSYAMLMPLFRSVSLDLIKYNCYFIWGGTNI